MPPLKARVIGFKAI